MIFRTDDPLSDFAAWDREQADVYERLPECADCGERIMDETAYYIGGEWICEDCIEAYRRDVVVGG